VCKDVKVGGIDQTGINLISPTWPELDDLEKVCALVLFSWNRERVNISVGIQNGIRHWESDRAR
jgi:hypothetical protein